VLHNLYGVPRFDALLRKAKRSSIVCSGLPESR